MEHYMLIERDETVPEEAELCLLIEDDCMEPLFEKGQLIYVSRHKAPREMEAGLFLCCGEILCRLWCEDYAGTLHLLCANPKYQDEVISLTREHRQDCLCLGKVFKRATDKV